MAKLKVLWPLFMVNYFSVWLLLLLFLMISCSNMVMSFETVSSFFNNEDLINYDHHYHSKQPRHEQYDVTLNGVTVLNPPFIYSESGPYRGFCVDVLKELSQMLKFQFTLRQSFDGQIGSVRNRDGVFGEIIEKYVEFAIGDISSNWLNNRLEAERNGIMFTRPIYVSTMKVLLTKTLYQELLDRKRQSCENERKKNMLNGRINETTSTSTMKTLTKNNINDNNNYDQIAWNKNCSESELALSIHDIFNYPDLIRVIFKGGAVHRFYSTLNIDYLNDLIIVERASLSTLLARLQKLKYVLIDESKFIDYFVDHECQYTSIDVAHTSVAVIYQNSNLHFDNSDSENTVLQAVATVAKHKNLSHHLQQASFQQFTIRKEELFQNEISIAFSKSFLDSVQNSKSNNNNRNKNNRNWLLEFDRAIEIMEKSGLMKRLRDKHWANSCRRGHQDGSLSFNGLSSPSKNQLSLPYFIIFNLSISILIFSYL